MARPFTERFARRSTSATTEGHFLSNTPAINGNTFSIRVVDIGGDPWFVAADVCHALSLHFGDGQGTVKQHCRNISDDEMMLIPKSKVTSNHPRDYPNRGANCVSESGLYKLILRSDKPQAKPFQDWVTRVVLPAIRKDEPTSPQK